MIRNKAEMYRLLSTGAFGNTTPQFFSVREWLASPDRRRFPLWGIRSAHVSAHPACRLHCPTAEVATYARKHFPDGPNISMMVDAVAECTAWIEVWDSPLGLVVEGIEHPRTDLAWNWRNSMRDPRRRRRWEGVAARALLARHLNPNSRGDLTELLERYPDHVVELTALDRCLGSVPHRNGIVWECRLY